MKWIAGMVVVVAALMLLTPNLNPRPYIDTARVGYQEGVMHPTDCASELNELAVEFGVVGRRLIESNDAVVSCNLVLGRATDMVVDAGRVIKACRTHTPAEAAEVVGDLLQQTASLIEARIGCREYLAALN